ncbi:hypothetical protein, partial [Streptomyces sp. NPDC048845]|uniref:hypothetical protein n=1 Tax=Streptomyces sp. NPDC048845 TaxID=3155390 RepID=UPI00342E33D7
PGRIMSGEMAEQPAVLRRILDEGAPRIREIAAPAFDLHHPQTAALDDAENAGRRDVVDTGKGVAAPLAGDDDK